MVTQETSNYVINIGLHILILFTFLTVFFFVYISKLEKKGVDQVTKKFFSSQTENMLTEINNVYPLNTESLLNWSAAIKVQGPSDTEKVNNKNKRLQKLGIGMILGLLIILIILSVFFTMKGVKPHFTHIVIENLVMFAFIGMVEFFFFTKVASNYVPATPDVASNAVLDNIKNKLQDALEKKSM